jgi:hypothetical protein
MLIPVTTEAVEIYKAATWPMAATFCAYLGVTLLPLKP